MQYGLATPPSATFDDINVLFVTKTMGGTLARGSSRDRSRYISAGLRTSQAVASYDYGFDGSHELRLDEVPLTTKPYFLSLLRSPTGAQLTIDGLGGRYTTEIRNKLMAQQSTEIPVDQDTVREYTIMLKSLLIMNLDFPRS
jgi:hypothetical protein